MNNKLRKIMYLTVLIVLIIIIAALTAGLLLPKERVEVRKSEYNISQKRLFDIVTNNKHYAYRSDITNLVILNKEDEMQTFQKDLSDKVNSIKES